MPHPFTPTSPRRHRLVPSLAKAARRWLGALALSICALPALAAVPTTERQALTALYNNTNGAGWLNKTNWLSGDPCDNAWYGITCDSGKTHVTEVGLASNGLTGPLPATLNQLTALQTLNVSQNQLSGSIPSLSGLTVLRSFMAFKNQLSGPIPNLGGLSALGDFSVYTNQLTGPIPSLSGLTALWLFDVASNKLTGSIPNLDGLPALTSFYVSANLLTGAVPATPSSLIAGGSRLCPNYLATPSPTDAAWDAATGTTPWSRDCTAAPANAAAPVPTLGQWALALLCLLLAGLAWARRWRPRVT